MSLLSELLSQEWESEDEKQKFAEEIVRSIVGDEKTIAKKVVNIQEVINAIDAQIEKARAWKKDIDRQIKIATNVQERVKEYALECLKIIFARTGQKYVESDGVRISYQAQGHKHPVVIDDDALVSYKYYDTTISITLPYEKMEEVISMLKNNGVMTWEEKKTISADRVRSALLNDQKVEGAHIAPQAEGIRIKNVLPGSDK
jgi:polyhydroxyalkanoate synthesis regulator phasin